MNLPAAIAHWDEELSIFPDDIALSIGALAARLAALVGLDISSSDVRLGEPDGYAGLSRRGSYERLLHAEWLLAEELPEEFERRAAQGEHLFWDPARRELFGARALTVLFDTGPDQLGTPRIAQLAALVLLSERARRASATFRWGRLQAVDAGLVEGYDEQGVRILLDGPHGSPLTDEMVEAWTPLLPQTRSPEDLWLVGSNVIAPTAEVLGCAFVAIEDVFGADRPALHVAVSRDGARTRRARVELPEPNQCARLVRDPFKQAPVRQRDPWHGLEPNTELRFTARGDRVLARLANGGVVAYHVPTSPRASPGKPRRFIPLIDEDVVAVGWQRRAMVVLTRMGDDLRLYNHRLCSANDIHYRETCRETGRAYLLLEGMGNLAQAVEPHAVSALFASRVDKATYKPIRSFDAELPPFISWAKRSRSHVELYADRPVANPLVPEQQMLAFDTVGTCEVWAFIHEKSPGQVFLSQEIVTKVEIDPHMTPRVFIGVGATKSHARERFAIEHDHGRWEVTAGQGTIALLPLEGMEVVGVSAKTTTSGSGLLVLEDGATRVSLLGRSGATMVCQTPVPIVSMTSSLAQPNVAWLCDDGVLEVYSLEQERTLMAVQTTEGH